MSKVESDSQPAPVGRFAPSTTGPAHPGTLLAALLCWLDARAAGGRVVLRLEDLDRDRSNLQQVAAMEDDLAWLGLDWDDRSLQSGRRSQHENALDRLESRGVLYLCHCSRSDVRAHGERAPDGGWRYPGTCRDRGLPPGGWRGAEGVLRARLPDPSQPLEFVEESGWAPEGDPAAQFGDPVVRRRDGAVAYHLASVVDDADAGVTRVVRGRDLAPATGTQVRLQQLLGLPTPCYRHHLLLLEESGGKLAKLHGSVGMPQLRRAMDARALTGWLAWAAGLQIEPAPNTPHALLASFTWTKVAAGDRLVRWTGSRLELPR